MLDIGKKAPKYLCKMGVKQIKVSHSSSWMLWTANCWLLNNYNASSLTFPASSLAFSASNLTSFKDCSAFSAICCYSSVHFRASSAQFAALLWSLLYWERLGHINHTDCTLYCTMWPVYYTPWNGNLYKLELHHEVRVREQTPR